MKRDNIATPVERVLTIRNPNVDASVQRVFLLLVGIDPGTHTGFAVWDAEEKRFQTVTTVSFWECIERLQTMNDQYKARRINKGEPIYPMVPKCGLPFAVFIENTKGNSFMYARHQSKGFASKIARNVGMNQRDAELIMQFCTRNHIPLFPITPTKRSITGMKSDIFRQHTGFTGRTSEHARDAAMLVFDKKPIVIV